MPAALIRPSLTTIAPQVQHEAQEVIRMLADHSAGQVLVDVGGQRVAVPPELSSFLMNFVEHIASGSAVGVRFLPQELTTTTAAEQIGVSRPTLMKMIRAGDIASHKVGTHTRLKSSDVLAYMERRRRARVAAAAEINSLGDDYTDED